MKTTIACFLLVTSSLAFKLPSTFQKCKQSDAKCLSKAVDNALKQLDKPFDEIRLPSLEPLELPELIIGEGTGAVNLVQNYKNVKLYGFTKPEKTAFEVDAEKKMAKLTLSYPQIKMVADYDVNGKILLLPVYGNGQSVITLEKLVAEQTFELEEFEKKGKKYWKVTGGKLTMNPSLVTFNLDNLFNGDKALGDNINKVLNENWSDVYKDVQANYEEAFGQICKSLFNNVLSRVPLDDFFEK